MLRSVALAYFRLESIISRKYEKNSYLIVAIVCLLVIVGVVGFQCLLHSTVQKGEVGRSSENFVLLKQAMLTPSANGIVLRGESVQFLTKDTGMDAAAITDGVCTEEDIANATCLNNLFYIRDNGYQISIPVSKDVVVEKIDQQNEVAPNGVVVQTVDAFLEAKQELPYLLRVEVSNNEAVRIEEVYIP